MRFNEGGHPDHLSFAGLRGGGKGGSSGGSQMQQSFSSTTLPAWLDAASQGAVQQAQNLAAQPYQPYTGQMVADPTAAQNAAYQSVWNMQGMGMPNYGQDISALTNMTGSVAPVTAGGVNQNTNQLYGNYVGGAVLPSAGLLGGYLGSASPATAQQVASNTMQLMSPYEQAVIAPSMAAGQQALAQNLQQVGFNANQAGAYGGSRQGVMEGVAQAQTSLGESQQIANLLNTGYQANITPATALATNASAQGYNAANTLAGMLQSGYGNAQTAGQNIANTNLSGGLTAAQQLPTALTAQQTAAQQQASLLQTIGAAQQQQQQAQLNAQLGQYYQAQEYPYQSLDTLLSAVGSVPYGTTTYSQTYGQQQQNQQRNMAAGVLGGAATGASIGSAFGPIGTAVGAAGGGILGAL